METTAQLSRPPTVTRAWQRLALAGILLLALFLHFFRLEQEGYANLYYAAAVKSQLTSWHNFFFNSFDPGGFVTVDKPPLGLWVQTASAALFGFSGFSLLLPQAAAGVLSVLLLYHLVRRTFGPPAGLTAALVLAITPISVAANRNNTMDSQLVLVLLLAAWAVIRAAETGRLRWLLACATLVGLGFNIKMLQAFMVLPAFYLLYLVGSPARWWKRLVHLGLATVVLLIVSFAWAVAVDLTPPDARPYIGSSSDNSVLELVIGHNGMSRLLPGGLRALDNLGGSQSPPAGARPGQPPRPSGGQLAPGQGGGAPFSHETGDPGWLRLFNRHLAGQITWLLPLAGLGLLVAGWQTRLRFPLTRRHQNLLLWFVWLLPMLLFFSMANLFHRYYLEMLSPAIAALVGAGVAALWEDYHRAGWRGWLLPLALLGSAAFEALILSEFPDWSRWLTPLVVGLCLLVAGVLVVARPIRGSSRRAWLGAVTAVGLLALLVPLLVWASIPVWYGGHSGLPYAGPDLLQDQQIGGPKGREAERLVDYLQANRGDETYLAVTPNAQTAAPLILATGEPVMALGGFTGGDQILTQEELVGLVSNGAVRFFLISGQGNRQNQLSRWVMEQCVSVPPEEWGGPPGGPAQLFDCGQSSSTSRRRSFGSYGASAG